MPKKKASAKTKSYRQGHFMGIGIVIGMFIGYALWLITYHICNKLFL